MFYVYILYNPENKKTYVGQTNNLDRRFSEHIAGGCITTRKLKSYILTHKEIFPTRREAMKREKFLKSLYSANFKKKIIKEFLSTARQNLKKDFE